MTEPPASCTATLTVQQTVFRCTLPADHPQADWHRAPCGTDTQCWTDGAVGAVPHQPQPARHTADTITDNDLDQLYARAEKAEAANASVREALMNQSYSVSLDEAISAALDGPKE